MKKTEKISLDVKQEKEPEVVGQPKPENLFSKEQLLMSERFADRKDALNALLTSDKQYSISEVEKLLDNFLKGKVK